MSELEKDFEEFRDLTIAMSMAHRQTREHAADCFVKAQKAIKELEGQR